MNNINKGDTRDETRFGRAVTSGNFNGDKFDDLAIGVPYALLNVFESEPIGSVNIIFGTSIGLTATYDQHFTQHGASRYDLFGDALSSGDFNNDGYPQER